MLRQITMNDLPVSVLIFLHFVGIVLRSTAMLLSLAVVVIKLYLLREGFLLHKILCNCRKPYIKYILMLKKGI